MNWRVEWVRELSVDDYTVLVELLEEETREAERARDREW